MSFPCHRPLKKYRQSSITRLTMPMRINRSSDTFAAAARVKFTSFAFISSNSVGIWPNATMKMSASFPTTFTTEIKNTH